MKITIKIFFLTLSLVINAAYAMMKEDSKISAKQTFFKMGFEFQESSNLCPWAKGNYNIQKKPFFSCFDKNKQKLWSVVIDGADIEFVTEPFANNQRNDLINAMQGIIIASSIITQPIKRDISDLQKALNSEKIINLIGIGKNQFEQKLGATLRESKQFPDKEKIFILWRDWLITKKSNLYKITDEEKFKKMWESTDTIVMDIVFKHSGLSENSLSIDDWVNKTKIALLSINCNVVETADKELFSSIKDKIINLPTKLFFEPQITIQYPVEYSIPLWFGLFGFEEKSSPVFFKFKKIVTGFKKERSDVFNKNSGFIFLHALTLCSMAPSSSDDDVLLMETFDRIGRGQADVKGLLYLMSRRPFSNMWQDINVKNSPPLNYTDLFYEKMGSNKFFAEIKGTFYQTNYAEEYLDKNNHIRKDLKEVISPLLDKTFYKNNFWVIDKLLSLGLLSTTMIRNFDKEKVPSFNKTIFENYYTSSIESVQHTNFPCYRFDVEKKEIISEKSFYDILSPPYFLDTEDAMGYYNDDFKFKIDKEFGEAIIEARQIKKVGMYFLEKAGLQNRKEVFLTEPEPEKLFLSEAVSLFDFINLVFDKKKNIFESELIPAILKGLL